VLPCTVLRAGDDQRAGPDILNPFETGDLGPAVGDDPEAGPNVTMQAAGPPSTSPDI